MIIDVKMKCIDDWFIGSILIQRIFIDESIDSQIMIIDVKMKCLPYG